MTRFYPFECKPVSESVVEYSAADIADRDCGYYAYRTENAGGNITFPQAASALRAYSVCGKNYVYCKDGMLYEIDGKSAKAVIDKVFDAPPCVFSVFYKGSRYFAASDGTNVYLAGLTYAVADIPAGSAYAFAAGRLFAARDGALIFTDIIGEKKDAVKAEFGRINLNAGKILFLSVKENCITAVCRRAVFELRAKGDPADFTLSEKVKISFDADKDSFGRVGKEIYFTAEGAFYVYSDGAVSRVAGEQAAERSGCAFTAGEKYYLPVTENSRKKLFCYDPEEKKVYYIDADNMIFADGGFAVNTATATAGDFYHMVYGGKNTYKTRTLDLGVCGTKRLTGISISADRALCITLGGDFGSISLKEERPRIKRRLNLRSDTFTAEICAEENADFKVDKIRFYFRKGENL